MPLLALGAALNLLAAAPASPSAPGAELIGRPAPAWSFERWIRTAPLSLDALRGKVVLIRWLHGGGEYHPSSDPRHATCDLEYRGLEKVLASTLAEPATAQ